MATPDTAKIFEETLDPYDVLDFEVDVAPLLEVGEGVASYELSLPTESTLLGLEILTTDGYVTTMESNIIRFYVGIELAEQANPAFVAGATLPIEVNVTTNSVPPRKKQRTVAVTVVQR